MSITPWNAGPGELSQDREWEEPPSQECGRCDGTGAVRRKGWRRLFTCPQCQGSGVEPEKCPDCNGTGAVPALGDEENADNGYVPCRTCSGR